jgi:hypothetical protein
MTRRVAEPPRGACGLHFFTFGIAATSRERIKLVMHMVLAGVLAVGALAAAQSIPKVAELMGERASYDVGPEGHFGVREKLRNSS